MGTDLPSPEGTPIGVEQFKKLELSTANSSVVPIVVVTADAMYCVGTAFCISSLGLWVTARHVLDGRGGAIELKKQNEGSYLAILWVGSGTGHDVPELLGGIVPISAITRHPVNLTDLALLRAHRPNVEFPPLTLSAILPLVDMPIIGAGYPQLEITSDVTQGQQRFMNIEPNLHTSSGKVSQIFKNGRNKHIDLDGNFSGMLPTVCFETSARFDAGMSGGPVLNPNNVVCGVISTGLEKGDDEAGWTSFASGTPYLFTMKMLYGKELITVYELAKRRYVPTDESFEQLRVTEGDGLIRIDYDPPMQR